MNYKKARIKAEAWVYNTPKPREIPKKTAHDVLKGIGFELLGEISSDTATIWKHSCLTGSQYFKQGVLRLAVGHKKGSKPVIRRGGVNNLLIALEIYIGDINE